MVELSSSLIRSVDYHHASRALEVTFTSGRTYRYEDVPESAYTALLKDESAGTYFNSMIRGAFPYTDITGQRGRAR